MLGFACLCASLRGTSPFHSAITEGRKRIYVIKGWKELLHDEGFLNETTQQILVVEQKQFSLDYHVIVYEGKRTRNTVMRVVSPEFETEAKAMAFAVKLMLKNPNGIV